MQAQVVNLLDELKDSLGLTLLFIAHDLSMVRYVSDRMAVMYLGSLVEIGPANRVFFAPKHPYTELLIGSNPEPDPKSERTRESTAIKGEIPSPVNVPPGCRFANRCPEGDGRVSGNDAGAHSGGRCRTAGSIGGLSPLRGERRRSVTAGPPRPAATIHP